MIFLGGIDFAFHALLHLRKLLWKCSPQVYNHFKSTCFDIWLIFRVLEVEVHSGQTTSLGFFTLVK